MFLFTAIFHTKTCFLFLFFTPDSATESAREGAMSRIPPHGSVKRSFAATLNNPDSAYVAKLPETELQTATRALLAGTIMSEFHLKI